MTITEFSGSGTRTYFGLSTDIKPTPPGTVVPVGSTFFESDTTLDYVYTGSAWVLRDAALTVGSTTPNATLVTPVNNGLSVTADQNAVLPATDDLRLFGYSVMEDAGGPASFRIMRGLTAAGGIQVELVSLAAGESTADYWGPDGTAVDEGVSVDWISGSFRLSLKSNVRASLPAALLATAVNAGASVTADQNAVVPADPGLRLFGYSVMEDAGSSASFRIMEGPTAAGGTQVEPVSIVANESTADYWGPEGVLVAGGVSVDWISGSFKLSLKTKVV